MFQELEPHLSKVNMVITLQQKKDKLLYSITLKGKDDKDLNIIPLVGTATAAELDEAFPGIVEKAFGGSNGEAIANIVEFGEALKRKAEADKATAAAKTASKTTTVAPATKKEDKPLVVNSSILKGDEQKAWKKAMEFVTKAKAATDPDMINFLEKQAITEAEKVKSQAVAVPEIKNNFGLIRTELEKKLKAEPPKEDGLFSSPVEVEADTKKAAKQVKDAQKEAKVVTIPEQPKEAIDKGPKSDTTVKPKAEEGDPFGGTVAITSEDDDTDEDEDDDLKGELSVDEQQEEAEDDNTDAPVDIDIF